jgi:dihydroorotate dehydrogenase
VYERFHRLLLSLDAERAHNLGTRAARLAQTFTPSAIESQFAYEDTSLWQSVWGLRFRNPVGLAAGFDKNARLVRFWSKLGFGFAEVGSVSARPASGNKRPRAFRLPEDQALLNRMGLNNQGARRVAKRLSKVGRSLDFPVGINLAKTHDPKIMGDAAVEDFLESFRLLAPLASYVALNISCPNTKEGKTFEDPVVLDTLLMALFAERRAMNQNVPILLKLSPPPTERVVYDSQIEDIVALAHQHGVAGLIATNTTTDFEGLNTPDAELERIGNGGLSGAPLEVRSTRMVRYLYNVTDGKLPIIGVGGVASPESAYAKIRAGASLVQLYTGLVYEGPGVVKHIKQGLAALLRSDGFSNIKDAIGIDVRAGT